MPKRRTKLNFFEAELKKIMAESAILKDQKYVGRICYGTISDELRARIENYLSVFQDMAMAQEQQKSGMKQMS